MGDHPVDAVVAVGGVGGGGGGAIPGHRRQQAGLAEGAPSVVGSVQPSIDALQAFISQTNRWRGQKGVKS